jgi:cytochrome o ubiquinol oxidase operon protein cyoD
MATSANRDAPSMRPYLIGLGLAVLLTAIPFALVAAEVLPRGATMAAIAAAAVVQILVHLRFFLHIRFRGTAPETMATLALTAILVLLMVGGTLWIMFDLNRRMGIGQAEPTHAVAEARPGPAAQPAAPPVGRRGR